jgi:hypothetical protein
MFVSQVGMAYLDRQALQDINARWHGLVKEVVCHRFVFRQELQLPRQLEGCVFRHANTELCKQCSRSCITSNSPSHNSLSSCSLSVLCFFFPDPHFKSRKHKAHMIKIFSAFSLFEPVDEETLRSEGRATPYTRARRARR